MPHVSVIVPIFNVSMFIERCVTSLFEQTMEDIEYIFVDDCTPDDSMKILEKTIKKYPDRKPHVKIVTHESNKGLPAARRSGLAVATGDYIIHCDSDDWVECTMYEKMYQKAIGDNCDMVICGYRKTDGENSLMIEDLKSFTHDNALRCIISDKLTGFTWNKLIRKSIYSSIDSWPTDNLHEDCAIVVPMAYRCRSIGFVYEPLYNYLINRDGISNSNITLDKLMQMQRNEKIAISYIEEHGGAKKYKRELLHRKCLVKSDAFSFKHGIYLNIFPETNYLFFFDTYSSISKRLGHLTKLLGIHGISKYLKRD